jgi:glutamyl/glutaminyl-tRNA synthetase
VIVSRFAPSTTGQAHPGTLLSALLVWLDARAAGGRVVLRLEDVDPVRCRPAWADELRAALAWLGLDWDEVIVQSSRRAAHEAALDQLAAAGRLYPCRCSRADRAGGRRAPDGGWAYDNRCRGRALPELGWRACDEPLRVRLDDDRLALIDLGGLDLSQTPAFDMGDPVVLRRDGALAYQLVVVVDDAAAGITHVVRGRDIAPSTATQVALQRLLGVPTPAYRHHLLLLEPHGAGPDAKLAKLHGAVGYPALRARYTGAALCGILAAGVGLVDDPAPIAPRDLLAGFTWARVATDDRIATWTDHLAIAPA